MKTNEWEKWKEQKTNSLSETAQKFLRESAIVSVRENEVVFTVQKTLVVFKKISDSTWQVPSSLFVRYGSLSSLFEGFNVLIKENN